MHLNGCWLTTPTTAMFALTLMPLLCFQKMVTWLVCAPRHWSHLMMAMNSIQRAIFLVCFQHCSSTTKCNGRFAEHPRFRYFALNTEMRWHALQAGQIYSQCSWPTVARASTPHLPWQPWMQFQPQRSCVREPSYCRLVLLPSNPEVCWSILHVLVFLVLSTTACILSGNIMVAHIYMAWHGFQVPLTWSRL